MIPSLPALSPAGVPIRQAGSGIALRDRLHGLLCRIDIGRMDFKVAPGLYALGSPGTESPVFVSANYGLSFNILRRNLAGTDGWILVLDTRGINVWCAAGKGTFGTAEIVKRVLESKLSETVTHRRLIVPQLGAPGISAHQVRRECGFSVIYGPVRARDIKAFMAAGEKALPEMRRVRFPMVERAKLIGVEFVGGVKYALPVAALLFLLSGITRHGYSPDMALLRGGQFAFPILAGLIGGAVLIPLFLPFLPGRTFAVKGFWTGLILALLLVDSCSVPTLGALCISASVSSFLAMNFTGASTFTSLSGVLKEMKMAVPLQAILLLVGIILTFVSFLKG